MVKSSENRKALKRKIDELQSQVNSVSNKYGRLKEWSIKVKELWKQFTSAGVEDYAIVSSEMEELMDENDL